MNAQTFTPIQAVIAIYAMPRSTKQQERENHQQSKRSKEFDSVFEDAVNQDDTGMDYIPTGCYSKDAKHVVGNVSHFHASF